MTAVPNNVSSTQFGRGGTTVTDPLPLKMYTTRRFYENKMPEAEFNDPTVRKYIDLRLLPKIKAEIKAEQQQKMMQQMQSLYKDSQYSGLFNQQAATTPAMNQYAQWMKLLRDQQALQKLQSLQANQATAVNNAYAAQQQSENPAPVAPGLSVAA